MIVLSAYKGLLGWRVGLKANTQTLATVTGKLGRPSSHCGGSFELISYGELPIQLDDPDQCIEVSYRKPRRGWWKRILKAFRSRGGTFFERNRIGRQWRAPAVFQRVDVDDLTASTVLELLQRLPPSRTSFIPPSPSWLSRNVSHYDQNLGNQTSDHYHTSQGNPPPPHTPSPDTVSRTSSSSKSLSPLDLASGDHSTQRLDSDIHLEAPEPQTSTDRHVFINQSKPGFITFAAPQEDSPSDHITHTHEATPTSILPHPPFESQLGTFDSSKVYSAQVFIPSANSSRPSLPLPERLGNLLSSLFRDSGIEVTGMDFTGKATEAVDYGGGFDYAGVRWFEDPPERPQPSTSQAIGTPFVPPPAVIEQNEMFEFALSAAPNVLYARYKQYGQLGVLAWCSEFGELIDALKELGFQGNMFVSTRGQALKTCEELLKLRLDVKMQIIIMYLSSQVARLRRFLDGDGVWNDYPEPQFPLDPRGYGAS